jgi:hypothetical protein
MEGFEGFKIKSGCKIEKLPNKACTRRWGFCRHLKHFLRLSIFPVGRRSAARPSAGNANRWLAAPKSKYKTVFDSQVSFW